MSPRFLRFLVVGATATAVNWLSGRLFSQVMALEWAVVAAGLVGMAASYVLNRLFVFGGSGRPVWQETARFAVVNAGAVVQIWLVTLGLAEFVFPWIGFTWRAEAVAHAIGVVSPVLTTYFGYKAFTFAKAPTPAVAEAKPRRAPRRAAPATPLAVDLDGTLLRTDLLFETLVAAFAAKPLLTLLAFASLAGGRARFKARVAELGAIDVAGLPARQAFVAHLERLRASGRPLHLVTAADHGLAQRVAARFGLFDSVHGSRDGVNLKGARKLARLQALFPDGFAYAGDSQADLRVWTAADSIVLAGADPGTAARARSMNKPMEAEFDVGRPGLRTWRRALRLHQWSKNVLIFVPLLLGKVDHWQSAALSCLAGFFVMGVAASATYLINDLADLPADRAHATKRLRPLASGDLPVAHAVIAAPLMLVAAGFAAALLDPWFAAALGAYVAATLAYSLRLKRKPLLDVHILGGLYTLRLVIGTILAGVAFSPWLFTFAFFFFTSLALAKRYAELIDTPKRAAGKLVAGRGYWGGDALVALALGMATSTASVLVIVEYLMSEAFPSNVYERPVMLWAAPVLVSMWSSRIWLLAHRGVLTADPVEFALRDRKSLVLGALLGGFLLLGRL